MKGVHFLKLWDKVGKIYPKSGIQQFRSNNSVDMITIRWLWRLPSEIKALVPLSFASSMTLTRLESGLSGHFRFHKDATSGLRLDWFFICRCSASLEWWKFSKHCPFKSLTLGQDIQNYHGVNPNYGEFFVSGTILSNDLATLVRQGLNRDSYCTIVLYNKSLA